MDEENKLVREVRGKSGTLSALLAPDRLLASCVRACVSRDTLAAELAPEERRNQFPPTPTCVITWIIEGHDSRLDQAGMAAGSSHMPVIFCGPHTQTSISDNPGPVHFLSLLIYPDAVRALTGVDIAAHINRYSAFEDVFDGEWQAMAHSVLAAADDGRRMRLIEDFLAPRWQAIHTEPTARPRQFHDWSQGVARRAARHGGGHSDRQIDRRIKAWTGQALRQLRGIGRSEDLLFRARQAFESKEINWSDIASASGYADQAHLCRELRRITGLRPNELRKMIAHESYWMYQVWARIPD